MTTEQPSEAAIVGANVRRLREGAGFSQAAVADHLRACGVRGAHPQMVAKIEQGTRTLKFTEGLVIAGLFMVHPRDLFFGEDSQNEQDRGRLIGQIRELELAREAADRATAELRRVTLGLADLLGEVAIDDATYQRGVDALAILGLEPPTID